MKKKKLSSILYREIKPAENLKDYIFCYWQFEYFPEDSSQELDHSVLPDGCASLVFVKMANQLVPHLVFSGPRTSLFKTQVPPNSVYIGIRFLPQAFEPIFGLSPQDIRAQNVPAYPYLKGLDFATITQKILRDFDSFEHLDQIFQQYLNNYIPPIDDQISKSIEEALAKKGQIKVKDLAATAHLGIRQFQRRFKYVTGLRPKEFLKIRRLHAAAIKLLLEDKDYQEVLLQSGYFDQAHFIHDFSLVAGTNPTLFGKYIAKIKHIDVG